VESASAFIDEKIKELGDWRGKMLARMRGIIHDADPEIVEEWKWMDSRLFPRRHRLHRRTYKNIVKMTFAKGAALKDPAGLFNSSLDGMSGAPSTSTKATRSMSGLEGAHPCCSGAQSPSQGQE